MRKLWTKEEKEMLIELYPNNSTEKLIKIFKRSRESIYGQAYKLKIYKTEEFLKTEMSGRIKSGKQLSGAKKFYFLKGHQPWNKGKKGLCIGGVHTQFKKGNLPPNTLYDGAIVIRKKRIRKKNGKVVPAYKWVRISKAKWEMLHVYNWEKLNGPVPKGFILVFKDKDTMNCEPDNLDLITRLQHIENTRNSDEFIAKTLAIKKGSSGKYDKHLFNAFLKKKDLLELKRQQLKLKQLTNEKIR